MKLQVNNSGAWKNVINFDADQLATVQGLAQRLGQLAFTAHRSQGVSFRVADEHDSVLAHWTPQGGWLPHRRAAGA
jgi:hypothetical protein